jgi:hypothetical protein
VILPLRILLHALAGLAIGACLVVLASASAFVLAFATSSRVVIPAVIEVWTSREANGTTALEFVPDPGGAGIVILGFAAIYTVATVAVARRRASRS